MPKQKHGKTDYKQLVVSTLSANMSYFLIGATVFVFLVVASFVIIRSKTVQTAQQATTQVPAAVQAESAAQAPQTGKTYVVQSGDYLWKIAESAYGSGFNAYDIAAANKITNPSLIYAGQKLIIPSIEPKMATTGEITPVAAMTNVPAQNTHITSYTVQRGDSLWTIAQNVYSNPYAWTKIAETNKLENPDLIFAGNVLQIPVVNGTGNGK